MISSLKSVYSKQHILAHEVFFGVRMRREVASEQFIYRNEVNERKLNVKVIC